MRAVLLLMVHGVCSDTEESVVIIHDPIQYIANDITSPTVTPATPSVSSETS